MFQISIDAEAGLALALIIAAMARLVWAFRRDPRGAADIIAPRILKKLKGD